MIYVAVSSLYHYINHMISVVEFFISLHKSYDLPSHESLYHYINHMIYVAVNFSITA